MNKINDSEANILVFDLFLIFYCFINTTTVQPRLNIIVKLKTIISYTTLKYQMIFYIKCVNIFERDKKRLNILIVLSTSVLEQCLYLQNMN